MNILRITVGLAIFLLLGCTAQIGTEPAALEPAPTEEPAPTNEAVEPVTVDLRTLTPEAALEGELIIQPQPGVPDPIPYMTQQVTQDLSARLDVSPDRITVVKATAVDWRDSSLGCPEPDMGYLTVITPGYWIILEVEGKQYFYHADDRGRIVLCPEERSEPPMGETSKGDEMIIQPQPGTPGGTSELVNEVTADLSKRENIATSAVNVVTIQSVNWSDSSLGCPEPGMNYLMVITPGYRIVLEADGKEYFYHTDQRGYFVLCPPERAAPTPPGSSVDQ